MRRHGLKTRIKKKATIGPRKGVSQENQDQILNLKSAKGRGRVVSEFCMLSISPNPKDENKNETLAWKKTRKTRIQSVCG